VAETVAPIGGRPASALGIVITERHSLVVVFVLTGAEGIGRKTGGRKGRGKRERRNVDGKGGGVAGGAGERGFDDMRAAAAVFRLPVAAAQMVNVSD